MNTHKESIDIPDGWSVVNVSMPSLICFDSRERVDILVSLQKLIQPEPCRYCGHPLIVEQSEDDKLFYIYHDDSRHCIVSFSTKRGYRTREDAILAANRCPEK